MSKQFDTLGQEIKKGDIIAYNKSTNYADLGLYKVLEVREGGISALCLRPNVYSGSPNKPTWLQRPDRAILIDYSEEQIIARLEDR